MTLTIPPGPDVPSLNDPANFNSEALSLLNWLVSNWGSSPARTFLEQNDFGIGGRSPTNTSFGITDCNDLTTGGMYTLTGVVDNGPSGSAGYTSTLLVMQRAFEGGASVTQMMSTSGSNPRIWFRVGTGDPLVWSPWRETITQFRINGTVAEDGGIATGAIMERGTNANGGYVRFANGTQICTHSLPGNNGGAATWTFPASFTTPPDCSVTASASVARIGQQDSVAASNMSFSVYTTDGVRSLQYARLIAVGDWF